MKKIRILVSIFILMIFSIVCLSLAVDYKFLAAATLSAADEIVWINNGFGTGQDYIKMSES